EEIAQNLLLFSVDTQNRPIAPLVECPQFGDVLELLIALRKVTGRLVFEGLAVRQAQLVEQDSPQGIHADLKAAVLQLFGQISGRTVRPTRAFVHCRTGRVMLDYCFYGRQQIRLSTASFLPAPLFFGRGLLPRPPATARCLAPRGEWCAGRNRTSR